MRELRVFQWAEQAKAAEAAKKSLVAPSQSQSPAPEEPPNKKRKKAPAKGKGKAAGIKLKPPSKALITKMAKKLKEEQEKQAAEQKARDREVTKKQWAEDLEALQPYLAPRIEPGDVMPVGGFDPWENGQFKTPTACYEPIEPPTAWRNLNMPDIVQNRPNIYGYRGVYQWKKNTTYYEDKAKEESEAKEMADARYKTAIEDTARIRSTVNTAIEMLEDLKRNQLQSAVEDLAVFCDVEKAAEGRLEENIEYAVILKKQWVKDRLAARCHVYIQQCTRPKNGACGHPACKRSFQHGQYRVSLEPSEWTRPWGVENSKVVDLTRYSSGVTYGSDGEVIMAIPNYEELKQETDEEVSDVFCVSCFEELLLRAAETGPITFAVISGTLPIDIRPQSLKDEKTEEGTKKIALKEDLTSKNFEAWVNPSPLCKIYSVVHPENRYDASGQYTLDDDVEEAVILWKKKLSEEGARHLKEKFEFLQDDDKMGADDEEEEVEDEEEDGPAVKLLKESGNGILNMGLAECLLRAGKHPAPHIVLPFTTGKKLVKRTEKTKKVKLDVAPGPTPQTQVVSCDTPLPTEKKGAKRKADGDGPTKRKKGKLETGPSSVQTQSEVGDMSVPKVKGKKMGVDDSEPMAKGTKKAKGVPEPKEVEAGPSSVQTQLEVGGIAAPKVKGNKRAADDSEPMAKGTKKVKSVPESNFNPEPEVTVARVLKKTRKAAQKKPIG
jgi:hypothetical protein